MKTPLAKGLALLGLGLSLGGCPSAACPRETFGSPRAVLQAYASMRQPARVMRAEARVDRRDETGRVRGTVLMLLERPDHVRFDVMTQFGPAAVLTSDGEEFALVDLRENRFYVGPSCAGNIERLLGLPLEGEDVARFLLGESPVVPLADDTQEEVVCDGGHYVLTRHAPDGRVQTLTYDVRGDDVERPPAEQHLRLRASEVHAADGSVEWRVHYDDYHVVEDPLDTEDPHRGVAMPFTVRFELPANGVDTLVRFHTIELNAHVPEGAFHQESHEGLEVVPVECGL